MPARTPITHSLSRNTFWHPHIYLAHRNAFSASVLAGYFTALQLHASVLNRVAVLYMRGFSGQLFIQCYLFFPGGSAQCAHKPAMQKLKAAWCAVMQFTGSYNERPGTRRATLMPLVILGMGWECDSGVHQDRQALTYQHIQINNLALLSALSW